ncbi:hypothetical protein [Persephonella sp.]
MGTIIIEIEENMDLKIKAKNIDEAIKKIENIKKERQFSAVKLKTKGFKFNREEAESR